MALNTVWAHFQDPRGQPAAYYVLGVSADLVRAVFCERRGGLPWSESIAKDVEEGRS